MDIECSQIRRLDAAGALAVANVLLLSYTYLRHPMHGTRARSQEGKTDGGRISGAGQGANVPRRTGHAPADHIRGLRPPSEEDREDERRVDTGWMMRRERAAARPHPRTEGRHVGRPCAVR